MVLKKVKRVVGDIMEEGGRGMGDGEGVVGGGNIVY